MKLLWTAISFATLVAGQAFAACTSPVGPAGAMMWNADYAVVQVCNGTNWVALGGNGNDGSSEVDPQVGTLTDGQWCTASGGVVNCTSDAPLASVSLDALTDVTLTTPGLNNILRHDGTGWVNTPVSSLISATGDRITSGTLTMSANDTGYVSLTTTSSTWGYLGSSGSYLPRISTAFASATTISASYLQIPSATTALACDAGVAGTMRYTSGTMQLCNGTSWGNIGLGLPAGAISAFATASCPAGWTEYTPARGRFLRGIDNGAGNDPSGTRVAGSAQADAFQGHEHRAGITNFSYSTGGTADGIARASGSADSATEFYNMQTRGARNNGVNGAPRVSDETRPKNVAVTFCQYAGFGSELASGITTLDGLADVMVGAATAGQVLAFDGASWVPSNTTGGAGVTALASLTDVSIPVTPTLGTVLQFDGNKWQAVSPSSLISGSQVAFSVHKNGINQTVATNTTTDLTWSTERFDTNNNFSSNRFTPTVSGKYLVTGAVYCTDSATICQTFLRKNGAGITQTFSRGSNAQAVVTHIVEMNGTTDYLELLAYNGGGTTISGLTTHTYFQGALINAGGSDGGGAATDLGGLTDVTLSSPSNGQTLVYDGSAWVNTSVGASGDRIVSGTTSIVAQSGGAISITTNGVTSAYWDASGRLIGGVAGFGTASPSATVHVSGTIMAKMAANDRACPPEQWGAMRFNETTKRLQICRQPE